MQKRGDALNIESPIAETLAIVARAVEKRVQDIVVMMLDRPRHKEIVAEIRETGASLRMIRDGDIAAAMAPSLPETDIDLSMGIGGSPEAVLGRRRRQMPRRRRRNARSGRVTPRSARA